MPSRRLALRFLAACALAGLAPWPGRCLADGQLRLLASSYPVWLLLRPLVASFPEIRLELLVKAQAGCPHDYSLTPQDMLLLSKADLLVVNGGGFEPFLEGAVASLSNLCVLDAGQGMPCLDGQGHGHGHGGHGHGHGDHGHGHDHEHAGASGNPHYFSSPLRAAAMVRAMAEGLAQRLPSRAGELMQASAARVAVLDALAAQVAALGSGASGISFVLQHDALSWFFHDAGLAVDCVLQAEADEAPSAAGLVALAGRLRSGSTRHVIVGEPQFPSRIVQMLSRETGAPLVTLDPLAAGAMDAPLDHYEAVMAANIATLRSCLAGR